MHFDNVAELAYELGQSSVYHIPSKTFDGEKNGYIFRTGDVGLGYYYNDNHEILKLVRLFQDYIATNQAQKEDRNLLSVVSLPNLAGSLSLDNEFNVCRPPRIGCFHNKDKNLNKEAVSIKKGALALADESGISMSKED